MHNLLLSNVDTFLFFRYASYTAQPSQSYGQSAQVRFSPSGPLTVNGCFVNQMYKYKETTECANHFYYNELGVRSKFMSNPDVTLKFGVLNCGNNAHL